MQPVNNGPDLVRNLIGKACEVILDKRTEVELAVTCLLASGHLLIEDVPGVGKTTLVQTLGRLTGLQANRIQFTVDLLPADILGGPIFNQKEQKFEFFPGPIFTQVVFADELNRASPRTQGALLQAMEEYQVSIDGKNHVLPKPFFVIATQNPHQQLGTFPLPESQLDRFLMSLELNYASPKVEMQIFKAGEPREKLQQLQPVVSTEQLLAMQAEVEKIVVSDAVAEYVSRILENSRHKVTDGIPLSTRAGLSLIRAAKAAAYIQERSNLRPEDVQQVVVPVLAHRLGGNNGIRKGRELALALLQQTQVPA